MHTKDATALQPEGAGATRGLHRLRVSVVAGPDADLVHDAEDRAVVAVGTATDNELVLTDKLVSRYHLELAPTPKGILLRDLGSLNGTYLGDARIGEAYLLPGSRVSLGGTELLLERGDPEPAARPEETCSVPGLVAESDAMRAVARTIHALAPASISVLIRGETGTGKELVARAIHDMGPRRDGSFVVVDCGSMPGTLVASELFGHERGAFTGADRRREGAFEVADGGTIFLDEVGELPMQVQPALLGVLERKRFKRVGGHEEIRVDVRVVAATHRDLRREVNEEGFRADLYFRLAGARIEIPPLRERREDIEPIVRHFVEETTGGTGPFPFGRATMEALRAHPWSGNVRELRNVVETALVMGGVTLDGSRVSAPPRDPSASTLEPGPVRPYKEVRAEVLDRFEQDYLRRLIEVCEGNASEAARRADVHRGYLLSLLRRHGLR